MFANFATAIPTGAAATFMLLFAMQSLISMQPGIAIDTTSRHVLDFVRVIPNEDVMVEDFPPIDLQEVVPTPPLVTIAEHGSGDSGIKIPVGPVIPQGEITHLGDPFTNNGPLMAVVRVLPHYPASAASRGLEGFVLVQFDVLGNGTVANISVLESSNGIFEKSAKQAASRFRFKAKVVDGVPQTSTGVQYQFTFKMDN